MGGAARCRRGEDRAGTGVQQDAPSRSPAHRPRNSAGGHPGAGQLLLPHLQPLGEEGLARGWLAGYTARNECRLPGGPHDREPGPLNKRGEREGQYTSWAASRRDFLSCATNAQPLLLTMLSFLSWAGAPADRRQLHQAIMQAKGGSGTDWAGWCRRRKTPPRRESATRLRRLLRLGETLEEYWWCTKQVG